ncbi:MAG: UDP-N-acetylglucosamine 1-carboxyvinyltransferase [Clostridia bacterium]|nr:UDP-N-acetylglucosamine 1-carboxyvinyltransferase [Clostridia bacterium]
MEKLLIKGGNALKGKVYISGAKNAAVAIVPAVLLSDEVCRIENVPNISDVNVLLKILVDLGARVRYLNKSTVEIDPRGVKTHIVTYEMTRKTRASSYFMGAMLGRFKKAKVAPPGGCDFCARPLDLHEKGFEALGATIDKVDGMMDINADRLVGTSIYLDTVSVGATINIMLAAVKARGRTIIENAAKEPHIVDLANFLNSMGANIRGAGTDVLKISGVPYLKETVYSIIPDQIEAGTYMVAAAATGGDVVIENVIPKHLESITAKLEETGVQVEELDDAVRVYRNGPLKKCNVKTQPHPGFPTDMQPQMVTMLTIAQGTSMVTEAVWDSRFKYIDYLDRMGAKIKVDGKVAVIQGVEKLNSAPVKAVDLRAGAAMIIAGLVADGVTEIENIHLIDRGYEDYVEKLTAIGADIERINIPDDPNTVSDVG